MLVMSFEGWTPALAAESWVAPGAALIGDVWLDRGISSDLPSQIIGQVAGKRRKASTD